MKRLFAAILLLLFSSIPGFAASILLTWNPSTDNVGVAGYNIFRNGIRIATSSTNSYTDTAILPNTTYTYTVSAFDAAGNTSAQSASVAQTTLPAATLYNIGMNLPWLVYYNNAALYADIWNQVSMNNGPCDKVSDGTLAPLDSTGAPTVAARCGFTSVYPSGAYAASWTGNGTITCGGSCSMGTVNFSGGVSTATLTVTQRLPTSVGDNTWNTLTVTPPVSSIKLVAPANITAPNGSMFLADTISKLSPFTTLRFMDALNTNTDRGPNFTTINSVTNWSDRTWPNEGSRGVVPQGMAYEDIINLANTTGKDIWINIPILATDDYVCRLARLMAFGEQGDKLNNSCDPAAPAGTKTTPSINEQVHIYVEESNEVWNAAFHAWEQDYCWGNNGTPPGGHTCPVAGGPTSAVLAAAVAAGSWSTIVSTFDRGLTAALVLSKRNHDIFTQVFGTRASQIRVISNTQVCCPPHTPLIYMNTNFGTLSNYYYGLATAPYFSSGGGTVNAIFSDLATQFTIPGGSEATSMTIGLTEAQLWNIQLIAYEGGNGLTGATGLTAQSDQRMFPTYVSYFNVWNSAIGLTSLFSHFTFAGAWVASSAYGSLVSTADHGSYKYDALISLTTRPGDINLDGFVNAADCSILLSNLGTLTGMWWRDGDLNHDGAVDGADRAILNQYISGAAC